MILAALGAGNIGPRFAKIKAKLGGFSSRFDYGEVSTIRLRPSFSLEESRQAANRLDMSYDGLGRGRWHSGVS